MNYHLKISEESIDSNGNNCSFFSEKLTFWKVAILTSLRGKIGKINVTQGNSSKWFRQEREGVKSTFNYFVVTLSFCHLSTANFPKSVFRRSFFGFFFGFFLTNALDMHIFVFSASRSVRIDMLFSDCNCDNNSNNNDSNWWAKDFPPSAYFHFQPDQIIPNYPRIFYHQITLKMQNKHALILTYTFSFYIGKRKTKLNILAFLFPQLPFPSIPLQGPSLRHPCRDL